jgi:hypothetical protein
MIAPELDDFAAEQERIADLRARGDFAPKTDPGFVFPVPMAPAWQQGRGSTIMDGWRPWDTGAGATRPTTPLERPSRLRGEEAQQRDGSGERTV